MKMLGGGTEILCVCSGALKNWCGQAREGCYLWVIICGSYVTKINAVL